MQRFYLATLVVLFTWMPLAQNLEDRKEKLRYLILDVHAAAKYRDFAKLEDLLPPIFKYSFGGDDTREGALRYYRGNPSKLDTLAEILETGCKQQGDRYFTCPPQNADNEIIYFGPRASFEYRPEDGQWRFIHFVEGD